VRALPGFKALLLAALVLAASASPAAALDTRRPDDKDFIDQIAKQYSFKKRGLRKLLAAAQYQPAILEAMDRPAEKAKLWYEYRPIFVSEKRIREGAEFWRAHRQDLDRASISSGVAPEYLAAILGVETYYGRQTGNYRVLDALATLAFDYPPRAKFFRDELEQFILLTRDMKMNPLAIKGSYAGAMGAPQFMPSNYRRYAVDATSDGRIDLWNNWPDVCASIGNYLKEHGWNPGEPVLTEATVEPDKAAELDGRKLVLTETVGSLQEKGVSFDSALPPDAPALLIAADEPDGVHWRVGYNNFYVITRYNQSPLYAMAVYELAAAIKRRVSMTDAGPVKEGEYLGLTRAGIAVTERGAFAAFGELVAVQDTVMLYESARNLAWEYQNRAAAITLATQQMLENGFDIAGAAYEAARAKAATARARIAEFFGDLDAVLVPAARGEAPVGTATGDPVFNRAWTLLHLPCVTLPGARGPAGMPVGVQIVGRPGEDARLLAVACRIEAALGSGNSS